MQSVKKNPLSSVFRTQARKEASVFRTGQMGQCEVKLHFNVSLISNLITLCCVLFRGEKLSILINFPTSEAGEK